MIMFENLSDKLDAVFRKLKGRGKLSEKNIEEGLKEVRLALLEADVHYRVAKKFIADVRERALGQEVLASLTPGQQVVKIVNDELTQLMGSSHEDLDLSGSAPIALMLVGLQGSGKTTTLAAVLDQINESKSVHVITLEDPVEYQHPHKLSTFNQRELGLDFDTYSSGLRAALRQAPKVILVGEMRDKETVEIGLSAAETGHLVLTTLHTVDAGSTVNRIIGMFPNEDERQIRIRLADAVRWVVCQRLLPKIGGGRVATFEIMGTNLRVQDTILHGESDGKTFYDIMEASGAFGMVTFDRHLVGLYEEGQVSQETAMAFASQRGIVGRGIDSVKSARGETTTDIEKLEINRTYNKAL